MTAITLRMPVDVVESLKQIAPKRGFSGYQALLKFYVSHGLRLDEQHYNHDARLIQSLKNLGVSDEILQKAMQDMA